MNLLTLSACGSLVVVSALAADWQLSRLEKSRQDEPEKEGPVRSRESRAVDTSVASRLARHRPIEKKSPGFIQGGHGNAEMVIVGGQVNKPGPVIYKDKLTIGTALGDAGGVAVWGDLRRERLIRKKNVAVIDLSDEVQTR